MTDRTLTTEPAEAPSRDHKLVAHLLRLRANPAARAELRRGDTPALEARALPYLDVWRLNEFQVKPALLFAAALTRFDSIPDVADRSLGAAAYATLSGVDRHDPSTSAVGRRVLAAQRQTLPLAHRTFTGLLTAVAAQPGHGLDWQRLWRSYQGWDHRDLNAQRRTRQRLLLDFYGSSGG